MTGLAIDLFGISLKIRGPVRGNRSVVPGVCGNGNNAIDSNR